MNEQLDALIQMRFVVGMLGQRTAHGWWDCDFLSSDGQEMLVHNFPRAPLVAGFTATARAAKLVHDNRIGRTGVQHLFRVEPDLETVLARRMASEGTRVFESVPRDEAGLLATLAQLAVEEIDSPPGPIQVGRTGALTSRAGIQQMAAHYEAAFRSRTQIFPYFAATR
jgi:hypothetical protein